MKNPAFTKESDEYYIQTKEFLLPVIPDGADKVFDLGCASGRFGLRLKETGKAKTLYGVEIFESAAKEAMGHYAKVHVGDIEEMDLPYEEFFDLIVCGDILEHLKNPENIVHAAHKWLKKDGRIVCCLPNIRYWRIAYKLMVKGDWEYERQGIMDHTHLRFFTTKSLTRMLNEHGFVVEKHDMRIAVGFKQQLFNRLTFDCFKEFLGFQIMLCARKT